MKLAALLVAFAPLLAACTVAPEDGAENADGTEYEAEAAGCDGIALRRCVDAGGGGGCSKHCIPQCRDRVASCIRGGGGAGCMSRCRDGDVTGGGSTGSGGFDTSRCSDPGVATQFMTWVQQNPSSFTANERLCWCRHWHKIKNANGYDNALTSRAAQLMCWGSTDGSVSLPNGDGKGGFPPGAAMAIYCQLNPNYSACR